MLPDRKLSLPIMISGTITDASGKLCLAKPLGHSVFMAHAGAFSIGFNCALGLEQLRPHIEEIGVQCAHPGVRAPQCRLAQSNSVSMTSRQPKWLRWLANLLLRIRQHCRRMLRHDTRAHRRARQGHERCSASQSRTYTSLQIEWPEATMTPDSLFVNVGERTNVPALPALRD